MKSVFRTITVYILIFAVLSSLASCSIPSYENSSTASGSQASEVAGFITSARKYDYKGGNVAVLNVENRSDKAYTITIKVYYKDSRGNNIATATTTFDGFPAGYSNNFFFDPNGIFNSFTYDITAVEYKGKSNVGSIVIDNARLTVGSLPQSTFSTLPNSSNIYNVTVMASFEANNISNDRLLYYFECAVITRKGEMYLLDNNRKNTRIDPLTKQNNQRLVVFTDTLWDDVSTFEFPSELEGATVLVSIKSVETCPSYQ